MAKRRAKQRRKRAIAQIGAHGWQLHYSRTKRTWSAWDTSIEEENMGDVGPVSHPRLLLPLIAAREHDASRCCNTKRFHLPLFTSC